MSAGSRSAAGARAGRLSEVTLRLTGDELKLRYRATMLGEIWSIARPLLLFGALYLIFTRVVRFNHDLAHYPLYLLMSLVLWTHFATVTQTMARSVVSRGGLVRKTRFPLLAAPLSASLAAVATLGWTLVIVLGFVLASGIAPSAIWLELVGLVVFLHALASGIGLLLAAAYLRFRDVAEAWTVALQLLFYGSAVLYPVALYPEAVREAAATSPLVATFTQAYHSVIDSSAPTAAAAAGGSARLLIPLGLTVLALLVGSWAFAREAPHAAERL
jgi:ABC-2 type transport system permease protein